MNLNKRETATILAGLRSIQHDWPNRLNDFHETFPDHFEGIRPLSLEQINKLCEKINTDVEPKVLKKPLGKRANKHVDQEGYLTVIVPVSLEDLLGNSVDNFDDILDGLILGDDVSGSLSDISWKVIGAHKGAILLEVTAQPEGTDFDPVERAVR